MVGRTELMGQDTSKPSRYTAQDREHCEGQDREDSQAFDMLAPHGSHVPGRGITL
jgi:hypothetical protein